MASSRLHLPSSCMGNKSCFFHHSQASNSSSPSSLLRAASITHQDHTRCRPCQRRRWKSTYWGTALKTDSGGHLQHNESSSRGGGKGRRGESKSPFFSRPCTSCTSSAASPPVATWQIRGRTCFPSSTIAPPSTVVRKRDVAKGMHACAYSFLQRHDHHRRHQQEFPIPATSFVTELHSAPRRSYSFPRASPIAATPSTSLSGCVLHSQGRASSSRMVARARSNHGSGTPQKSKARSQKKTNHRFRRNKNRQMEGIEGRFTTDRGDLLDVDESTPLKEDQAIGRVVTAQANFMRVLVLRTGADEVGCKPMPPGQEELRSSARVNGMRGGTGTVMRSAEPASSPLNSAAALMPLEDLQLDAADEIDSLLISAAHEVPSSNSSSSVLIAVDDDDDDDDDEEGNDDGDDDDAGISYDHASGMHSLDEDDRYSDGGHPPRRHHHQDGLDSHGVEFDGFRLQSSEGEGMLRSEVDEVNRDVSDVAVDSSEYSSSDPDADGAYLHPPRRTRYAGTEVLCVVRALLKKLKKRVLVGDKVLIGGIDWVDKRGMVENIIPRSTEIIDPPIANVDHVLVLFAFDRPPLEPHALSRFLVSMEATEVEITVAINKSDTVEEEVVNKWRERLRDWGYGDTCAISVEEGFGVEHLEERLRGRVTVLAGPSGVGKSSLINKLRERRRERRGEEGGGGGGGGSESGGFVLWSNPSSDEGRIGGGWKRKNDAEKLEWGLLGDAEVMVEHELKVSEVSERSGRGRHTTRHVTLMRMPGGGLLADTPGFNQPTLSSVTSSELARCFPEVRMKIDNSEGSQCGFANCIHTGEPDCIVGSDWERYSHYVQILGEVKSREETEKRTVGTKKESDVRYKKTGAAGVRQAEPRLIMKKHRRVSRRQDHQSLDDELWEHKLEEEDVQKIVQSQTHLK